MRLQQHKKDFNFTSSINSYIYSLAVSFVFGGNFHYRFLFAFSGFSKLLQQYDSVIAYDYPSAQNSSSLHLVLTAALTLHSFAAQ